MNQRTLRLAVSIPLAVAACVLAAPAADERPAGADAVAAAASVSTRPYGWRVDPKAAADAEKKRAGILYTEDRVPAYTLPDPLLAADGTRVTTREQWEQKRRPETLDLFRAHVYGRSPAKMAEVKFEVVAHEPGAMDGKAVHKRVRITSVGVDGKSFAFEASVFTPAGAKQPVPAFVLINNRKIESADPSRKEKNGFWPAEEIVARGYATAVFRTVDVDPDEKGEAARARGVRGVWPAGGGTVGSDAWATLSAWAWGASRVLDYLQTEPAVDAKRVAVIGHSRGGKTALWAGAQDERFAIAISNDSGEGGAAIARRKFGETTEVINKAFPFWFNEAFKQYNGKEETLPVDQHQLIALMAGRAVCVGSADTDLWADPRGEFLSVAHASPVFALYGEEAIRPDEMPPLDAPLVRGRRSYHVRTGGHNLTPYDWDRYMDFADRLWGRK